MSIIPKRRWLRFSLSTMFVLVTAVGIWLGWNVRVVRERRALVESLKTRGATVISIADDTQNWPGGISQIAGSPRWRLSWIRAALGDEPYLGIGLSEQSFTGAEASHFAKVLPEATITFDREKTRYPTH